MTDHTRRRFLWRASQLLGAVTLLPAGVPTTSAIRAAQGRTDRQGLTDLTAVDAVAAMRRGDITAEDYAGALLEQARRLQDLNVFCALDPDRLRESAREADKRRAAGAALGLLHGLPIPVKDSVNTRDLPTSNGTEALRDFIPAADAAVLVPLFAQGALLMGKTNLDEISLGWTSNSPAFGAVRNPYDPRRTPGGSSGGSAAAVAARIAAVAIAEDTYGSIRVPATFCGLAGLRPTFGRYPGEGLLPLSQDTFDTVGPLARTVRDLALFDRVVSGESTPIAAAALKGVRIAISPSYLFEGLEPEVARLVSGALDRLRSAGVQIVEAELPEAVREAPAVVRALIVAEVMETVPAFLERYGTGVTLEAFVAQAGPAVAAVLSATRDADARTRYAVLLRQRAEIEAAAAEYYRRHDIDALVFPPALGTAPLRQGIVDANGDQVVNVGTLVGRNVALGGCARLACLVLPIGLTAAGLPVGLEFDAWRGNDRRLLSLGLSLENVLGPVPPPALAA